MPPRSAATVRRARARLTGALLLGVLMLATRMPTCLAGGPFLIDHMLPYDDSGIWKRSNQVALENGVIAFEVLGALWEGGETRFGHTLWQSIDASTSSAVVAYAMKYTFSRVRPRDGNGDPNLWFKGGGNQSFPSGEVTLVSSVLTPIIVEYQGDHPLVWALELLPLYDAIGRMKQQAHFQSDVLTGWAIGTGAGIVMHKNKGTPYILSIMPHGIYVGIAKHF
jgi:membrane-associated phospholipid phosphatase